MGTHSSAIQTYIRAKDENRPHLMPSAFALDAKLEMKVKTGNISFPPASTSCNALDRRRQGASLHKMRHCGSGAFDIRYTLNSGAKSDVAGCPSWI
jgi:hypothetical protein